MSIPWDRNSWDAWHPREVHRRLARVEAPWAVAAGWALELHAGEERREHEDLEIAVPAAGFGEIAAALSELEPFVPVGDGELARWGTPSDTHQTWMLDRGAGAWRVDVFREPSDGDTWICRRDASIRMPYERLIERTRDGIPYVRPEVVLLFKAKAVRAKDADDFAAVLPGLDDERRRWLADALARVHPGHAWLGELS